MIKAESKAKGEGRRYSCIDVLFPNWGGNWMQGPAEPQQTSQ